MAAKKKKPVARPRPVWTEARLQGTMMAAAQHTCERIIARPPTELDTRQAKMVLGAATAGLKLIASEWEVIVRLEEAGAEWRLRVPLPSRTVMKLQTEPHEYDRLVRSLIDLGWIRVVGGGDPRKVARFELLDPRS